MPCFINCATFITTTTYLLLTFSREIMKTFLRILKNGILNLAELFPAHNQFGQLLKFNLFPVPMFNTKFSPFMQGIGNSFGWFRCARIHH